MKAYHKNRITEGDALSLINTLDDGAIDLIVCDGPYGVTDHARAKPPQGIQPFNLELLRKFAAKLKPGGSLNLFGKSDCIDFIDYRRHLTLKSKIVWYQPSRLAQGRMSFTNNYDLICYFVKGVRANTFNLDAVRVPQLVELTHRLRCKRVPSVLSGVYGKTKFNDRGKNPGDVWGDIKQLTYNSKELMSRTALNTIQKPERLIERLVLASSNPGDLVLDPFCDVGTGPAVCRRLKRDFIAFEANHEFVRLGNERIAERPRPPVPKKLLLLS